MAVGFAAKRVAPKVSLGVLLAASEFVDLLFPVFLLAGWEQARIVASDNPFTRFDFNSYPYTHSLAAGLFWAFLAAAAYWAARRRRTGAVVVGLVVLSHWVLDVISHQPDMPLSLGTSPKIGLGLWNSLVGTIVVEALMFAAGVWLYATTTRARDRIGDVRLLRALCSSWLDCTPLTSPARHLPMRRPWPGWGSPSGCSSSGPPGSTGTAR